MYQQILNQMRQAVRTERVVMTNHAVKEMKRDGLEFEDVTNALMTGEIVEQQFDLNAASTSTSFMATP